MLTPILTLTIDMRHKDSIGISEYVFGSLLRILHADLWLGDVITRDSGFMRGHGTYMTDDVLYAAVAGVVDRVNKLVSVTPLKTRSNNNIFFLIICTLSDVYIRSSNLGKIS